MKDDDTLKALNVCSFRSEPKPGAECYEAIWSQGRSCKACRVKCYRNGWTKAMADADNRKLVAETLRAATGEGSKVK